MYVAVCVCENSVTGLNVRIAKKHAASDVTHHIDASDLSSVDANQNIS